MAQFSTSRWAHAFLPLMRPSSPRVTTQICWPIHYKQKPIWEAYGTRIAARNLTRTSEAKVSFAREEEGWRQVGRGGKRRGRRGDLSIGRRENRTWIPTVRCPLSEPLGIGANVIKNSTMSLSLSGLHVENSTTDTEKIKKRAFLSSYMLYLSSSKITSLSQAMIIFRKQ